MPRNRSRTAKPLRAAPARKSRVKKNNRILGLPPPWVAHPRFVRKIRYLASGAVSATIVSNDMIFAAGTMAATTTSIYNICRSYRLLSVEVWAPPATQGSTSTVTVRWPSTQSSPVVDVSDTSSSVSVNAHIRTSPPKESTVGFWQAMGTNNNMFLITCPTSSIVDITYEFIWSDLAGANTSSAVVGATVGQLYFTAIDRSSSNVLAPIALQTIA